MQKHFNAKLLAHIVMITFAVASYGNVEAFLFDVHHNELVSNGLGVALGAGLVTMALLLSGMPMRGRDFHLVLVVTTALALMSGGIQAASYARDMEMYWACLMGFSLPVVGELGLALAVSAYQSAKRHERVHNAQDTLAEGIRAEIADAVSAIEPQKIRNSVNRAAERIAEAVVQHTVSDLLAELRTSEAHPKSEAEISFQSHD